jgi:hypothetical protein
LGGRNIEQIGPPATTIALPEPIRTAVAMKAENPNGFP